MWKGFRNMTATVARKRWYVLHVYSGFEAKVAESIREKCKKQGLEDKVEDILIPTEQVVEVKRGQRVSRNKSVHMVTFWQKWKCLTKCGTW